MKLVILLLLGFGIGAAGGTWLKIKNTPPPPPPPPPVESEMDSLAADSTLGDSVETHGDSTDLEDPADSTAVGPADPTADSGVVAVGPAPVRPPVAPPAPTGPTQQEIDEAAQSMARIFGQMDPAEAADVLQHMSDDEVEAVMRRLGTRKAAELMAVLPRSRAATMARRLMVPREAGQ